jgi:RNA recognition motif-containing protein
VANFYVGNLQWDTTEEELKSFFSVHGTVTSAQIIKDKETGRSRGFGFVLMPDTSAQTVIADLNGKELRGRSLTVNEARERESRSGGSGGGGYRGGTDNRNSRRVFAQ